MSRKLFALAALMVSFSVHAQTYPAKSIRWIVPYTGGGITTR